MEALERFFAEEWITEILYRVTVPFELTLADVFDFIKLCFVFHNRLG